MTHELSLVVVKTCALCSFVLDRLDNLHEANPEEPGFSAYTLLADALVDASRHDLEQVTNRDLDIHVARHLQEEVLVVQSCCTARTYRLASLGPAPDACAT